MKVSPDFSLAACAAEDDGIWIVPTQGGARRDLVKGAGLVTMRWTRDGKYLLYTLKDPSKPAEAWIVRVAGGPPRKLDVPFGTDWIEPHPDGRQAAVVVDEPSTELWVLENLKIN